MNKSSKKSSVNYRKKVGSGVKTRQNETEIALTERIKEQKCLYNISKLNELELSKEELFRQVIRFVKKGFRIPRYTEVAIKYNGKLYKSTKYRKRKWHISSVSERIPDRSFELRVAFHNNQSGTDENPFYEEEEQLIDAIVDLLSLKISQKDAEEKIRLSEQRFKGLIQEAVDMIAIVNRGGTFQYVSPSYKTILGYKPEKLIGTDFFDLIHPDDQNRVKKEYSDLTGGKKAALAHYRIRRKDGKNIWMQSTGTDMTDDPAINGIVVNSIDITEKKQEDQHLKLLESVVTNSSDGVLIMESDVKDETGLKIVYVNDAFTKMTGYSKDEVIGKNPRLLQGVKTDPEESVRLRKALRNHESCEIETINYKKDGEEFWNSFTISPVADEQGNYTQWVAIERDVTARKNRELQQQLLSEISQIFNEPSGLVETLGKVLKRIYEFADFEFAEAWLIDSDARHIQLAATFYESDGMRQFYKETEKIKSLKKGQGLPGVTWKKEEVQFWRNIDNRKTFLRSDAAAASGLKTAYGFPLIYNREILGVLVFGKKKDLKKERYYSTLLKELGLSLGGEIRRKKLEEELSRIFSSAPDIICMTGFDGFFKKVNPAMSQLLGYSEKELLSKPIADFVHPEDINKMQDELPGLNRGEDSHNFETRFISKSDKVLWLSWTTKAFENEQIYYCVAKDVTEQKELEVLLGQVNRLAKVGSWELELQNQKIFWSDVTKELHEVEPDYEPDLESAINYYKAGESRDRIRAAVENAIENGIPWDLDLKIITAKGNERWVRAIGEAEMVDGFCVRLFGSFQDITQRKNEQSLLVKKTRQLNAIAIFNALLIKQEEWLTALEKSLETFGEVVDADRVYYFDNSFDENTDEWTTSMRIEWVREGIEPQIDNPDHQKLPFGSIREFVQPLTINRVFNTKVRDLSDEQFRQFLEEQNIKSLLALPVMTGMNFRGIIGFDDCTREREWSEDEISFLQTISINLASAIENQEAEKALKQAYEENTTILESIGDGFFAVDHDWTVTYWNNMAEQMLEMKRDQILGENLWEHYQEAVSLEFYTQYHKAMRENVSVNFEEYFPPLSKWFEVNAYPSEAGLSVFFLDVTERKASEQRLKDLNRSLEEHARELAVSNAELEQFAFVASHDLQEPLRMVSSFLTQLENKYETQLDERGKKYIHFATDGAKRMRQIILDLLDYSRVGRVGTKRSSIDMNQLLQEIVNIHRKTIEDTQAVVTWEAMPEIVAAEVPMKQVMQNLIGNALKYQPAGNHRPEIHISSVENETHWEFHIQDNGIGIREEFFEKIFNIFQRLHNKDTYSGTGVGLAICKKIIEGHGGEIRVESKEGEGTTITFTIAGP